MRSLQKKPRAFRANKLFSERSLLRLDVDTVDRALGCKLEQLKFKSVKFLRQILDWRQPWDSRIFSC